MKLLLILLSVAMLLPACANHRLSEEPADLIAPGRSVSSLKRLGWEISAPMTAAEAAAKHNLSPASPSSIDRQSWESFTSQLSEGDELRAVLHNAGIGYAIFRAGELTDMYLVVIF